MSDFGGILQSTGFQLNSSRPLDLKQMCTTVERLNLTFVQRHLGMITFDTDLEVWKILENNPVGDTTVEGDWGEFGGSGSGIYVTTVTIGDTQGTVIINHDLGTEDLHISSYLDSDKSKIEVDVTLIDSNNISVSGYGVSEDVIFVIGQGGGGGGGSSSYSNSNPTPNTIGGIVAGSTFSNQTMEDMWNALLYPYQAPGFTSFVISSQATTLEVGDSVAGGSRTFTWGASNPSNINTNSIEIEDITGSSILGSGLANDGTEDLNIGGAISKTTNTYHRWRITGVNSNSQNFSRNYDVNWMWMQYYGESATTPLAEADIEGLRVNMLSNTIARTYAFNAGGYKYITYPSSLGTLTNFKDTSNNLPVPFESVYTVNVTNSFGQSTNYNVHRTTNVLGGSINIQAS